MRNLKSNVKIENLQETHIDCLAQSFSNKSSSIFRNYLSEQIAGKRLCWIALHKEKIVGYVTLMKYSHYIYFRENNIPEIVDLNVIEEFRRQGIGLMLLKKAENTAKNLSDIVGIGVGLYGGADGGYGSAQRLYVKCGYIPNGKGITYNYEATIPGNSYFLDDDLVLWFTKQLR